MISCQLKQEKKTQIELINASTFPVELNEVFDAHGGYGDWSKMRALSFTMESKGELHEVSLWDRKALITSDEKKIGFDGKEVWVTPDSVSAENARFYNGLFFYFFAMPFVLGDPGIVYESLAERRLLDQVYKGIKISYENGVGDAPKDNYILWYDPATFQMEWLMYTVTYGSEEESENYRLIRYSEWETIGGLKLPTVLDWYVYENDSVGEMKNQRVFSDIILSEEPFEEGQFSMPQNAQVAPF